jgi:hypothetical protein
MNQLYKEIMWYKKKIDNGKLQYFGKKDIGDTNCFTVILKDGSYFYINIGTDKIPYVQKRQVAYIFKELHRRDDRLNKWYLDSIDSDRGYYCYKKEDIYGQSNYVTEKMKYYKVDYNKEYDTGCWD